MYGGQGGLEGDLYNLICIMNQRINVTHSRTKAFYPQGSPRKQVTFRALPTDFAVSDSNKNRLGSIPERDLI